MRTPSRSGIAANGSGEHSRIPDTLLTVAASLFRERGYAATTTRELSSNLGMTNATLYHYVSGKEDLLYEICTRSLTHLTESLQQALADVPAGRPQLHVLVRQHVQTLLEDSDLHATMLIQLKALSPDNQRNVLKMRDSYEDIVRAILSEARAAGDLPADFELTVGTKLLLGALNWPVFWFKPPAYDRPATGRRLSADDIADSLLTMLGWE